MEEKMGTVYSMAAYKRTRNLRSSVSRVFGCTSKQQADDLIASLGDDEQELLLNEPRVGLPWSEGDDAFHFHPATGLDFGGST
jgi:hypothetical protein